MGLKGELFSLDFNILVLFLNILEYEDIRASKQPLQHSFFFLFVCYKVAHTTKMWSDKKSVIWLICLT